MMHTLRRLLPPTATERHLGTRETRRPRVAQPPTDIARQDVERSLKRGSLWALGSQIAVQAVRFAGVVVLARLLSPDDYGAAAVAVTIGAFSMILGDLGYGVALVQAPRASQLGASTAFWCAIGAGAIGSAVAALGAYPAALLLDEPSVTPLVIAGGLTLFLVAAGSASNALLNRSMSFGVIQGATTAAWVLGTASAIAAAALGAGAWALVLQQLILAAATSAVLILAARWRPSFEFSQDAFRSLSKFAWTVTGGHAFGALQPLVAVLLVGSLVGIEELGIWNLSMSVVLVPISLLAYPLAKVIYAAFARMRDAPERIAEVWLNGFTLLAAVVLPALLGLIAVAPDLVPLVFGTKWAAAVSVIQILSVWVVSRALQTWNTPVMDAAGKPHVSLLLNASVLIALPASIWLGSSFGIEGVAVAFALSALICGELPSFVLTTRELSLRGLSVLGRLRGTALAAAAMCVAVVFARHALETGGLALEPRVGLSIVVGAAVYALCLALLAGDVVKQLLGLVRGLGPSLWART
jgi:O-antigen/teichoic acid export membrane protein